MNEDNYHILAINPGSTSLKLAFYQNECEQFRTQLAYCGKAPQSVDEIKALCDELTALVLDELKRKKVAIDILSAIVGRGGLLPPVNAGGYLVTSEMSNWLTNDAPIYHASNMGALIANAIAQKQGIPAYIYDAVSSDEMIPFARFTGFPEIKRRSFSHVLNTKAAIRKFSSELDMDYRDICLIVAHLGGGISISAYESGRIIDVIPDDSFHFSPERAGGAPLTDIIDLCFSGCTKTELKRKQRGNAGLTAYLGTSDCLEVERRITAGDHEAELIYEAMAYWVSKGIASLSAAVEGRQHAIILTGALAHSSLFSGWVKQRVGFLAPVHIIAGENEMEALALGALRILRGEEEAQYFSPR